ncbi:MAG TPA: hypothetical protein VLA12_15110 [Planctomycetaceae bacterium]|nr:hypothetical protein [Planctomycetaceae bacterium]
MPNQASFLEWMWQNEPWLVPVLLLHLIGTIALVYWFSIKASKAPHYPTPRSVYLSTPMGVALGAFLGWLFVPNAGNMLGVMAISGFCGLILGAAIGLMVHLPKTAFRGLIVGLFVSIIFFSAMIPLQIKWGRDPWSNQAWESRLVMLILFLFVSAITACNLKMMRPESGDTRPNQTKS